MGKKAYDPLRTSRSREQSTKQRWSSENLWKVCLFYTQNVLWLWNMADTFRKNSRSAQRFVGFFLDCAFRMLIGWAHRLWSRVSSRNTFDKMHIRINERYCRNKIIHDRRSRVFHVAIVHQTRTASISKIFVSIDDQMSECILTCMPMLLASHRKPL